MGTIFRRALAVAGVVFALIAVMAASAATTQHAKVGDESLELRDSLAAFLGPCSAPATSVNPQAFAAAATTADNVPSINNTPWQELGPHSYFPDNRNYIDPNFSNSGSGSGFNTGRITGVAVAPNGGVYAAGAGGGIWRSTDAAHQSWTPVFDTQQTTAEGAVAVVGSGTDYTVYAGTGEPTINRLLRGRPDPRLDRPRRDLAARRRRRARRRGDLQDRARSGRRPLRRHEPRPLPDGAG